MPPDHFDVMIEGEDGAGLTVPGDSGLVWTTSTGLALAVHQAGTSEGPGGGPSLRAFGCFAFRIADRFGVEFRRA